MATLQKRMSRGYGYWSIVESRRVNGKPRPVILEYLGTAENLLKRLTEGIPKKIKSLSHGIVAVMLKIAEELEIVQTINRYVKNQQIRDGFTVGGSILVAAIGRIAHPTSKRNWYPGWARFTSLSYLTRMSLSDLDSQHFWDQMDAFPTAAISAIESDIISKVIEDYKITLDTLLYDTTNFFTYIDSQNHRNKLAQRGKSKQKRMDLRQFGLLLLVSRQDHIPLVHRVYQGNLNDHTIFKQYYQSMLNRLMLISSSLEDITLVFDQGNNSKRILKQVDETIYFVGSISPSHHKNLVIEANDSMGEVVINDDKISCYRTRKEVWGLDLTVVVYISEKLQQGQIRGINKNLQKVFNSLNELKENLKTVAKRGRKRNQEELEKKISRLVTSRVSEKLVNWELVPREESIYDLNFNLNETEYIILTELWLGRRILITNRHQWSTEEIIMAYWGQANVEYAFKNMKNPFHLALRPQFHWTDQKIQVHAFICLLSFLLSMIAYKKAKEQMNFKGSLHTLLEKLSEIRLATFIENYSGKKQGKYKVIYTLEEMDADLAKIAEGFGLSGSIKKTKIPFSVYN